MTTSAAPFHRRAAVGLVAALALVGAALPAATPAGAAEPAASLGPISVAAPWSRASAGMAKAGVAFMTLENADAATQRLVGCTTAVAEACELHTHKMEDGVMRMRQVPEIAVSGNGATALEPGGFHIMMMGLSAPLQEGETFEVTLSFADLGELSVPVEIYPVGAPGPQARQ